MTSKKNILLVVPAVLASAATFFALLLTFPLRYAINTILYILKRWALFLAAYVILPLAALGAVHLTSPYFLGIQELKKQTATSLFLKYILFPMLVVSTILSPFATFGKSIYETFLGAEYWAKKVYNIILGNNDTSNDPTEYNDKNDNHLNLSSNQCANSKGKPFTSQYNTQYAGYFTFDDIPTNKVDASTNNQPEIPKFSWF